MPKEHITELKHSVKVDKEAINGETKMVSLILSDETQLIRYSWRNGRYKMKLSHEKSAVDLSRKDILKLFYQHQTHGDTPPIGKLENIRVEDQKLKADAYFDSEDEFAMQIFGKIERGFLNSVSVGVDILDGFMVEHKNKEDEFTATKWQIHEASIVNIPAIASAKVGLSKDSESEEHLEMPIKLNNEVKNMTKEELQKEYPELFSEILSDGATSERERIKAIELAIPKHLSVAESIQDLKFDGKSTATDVQAALFVQSEKKRVQALADYEADGEALAKQIEGTGNDPIYDHEPKQTAQSAKEETARLSAVEKINKKRGN